MRRLLAPVLVSALLLGACGVDAPSDSADRDGEAGAVTGTDTTSTTEVDPTTTTETTEPGVVTTEPTTTTTERPAPADDHIVGSLGVIGVEHDDVLNLRSGPGVEHEILMELPPTADGLVGIGDWMTHVGGWRQIDADGQVGWVHGRYLAYLGRAISFDDRISPYLEGATPADLALRFGEIQMPEEGVLSMHARPDIVIADLPAVDEGRPLVVDLVGYEDDSSVADRFRIWMEPTADGVGWSRIDLVPLCSRGVSDEGLCV